MMVPLAPATPNAWSNVVACTGGTALNMAIAVVHHGLGRDRRADQVLGRVEEGDFHPDLHQVDPTQLPDKVLLVLLQGFDVADAQPVAEHAGDGGVTLGLLRLEEDKVEVLLGAAEDDRVVVHLCDNILRGHLPSSSSDVRLITKTLFP